MAEKSDESLTHYFLLPVFNEAPNIARLHENLENVIKNSLAKRGKIFFVFVDDGSTDETAQLLNKLFEETDHIILGDGINHGPGYAFNIGFEWILNHSVNKEDKIITLEGDNTSSLAILDKMLKVSDAGFDLVLASVYAQGGGFDKTTFFRKLTSMMANLLLRFFFDIKVLTLSSFYRIYTVEIIEKIKEKYSAIIRESGFISMIEILIKAIRIKASIIEVPMILYSANRKGKSKMKIFKTSLSYVRFLLKGSSKNWF